MELDAEKLLLELGEGKEIPEEQIFFIVNCLQTADTSDLGRVPSIDDLYAYLVIIGKLQRIEHRTILERYLDVTDVLTVSQVLETLCINWGATEEYLERVFNFALGVGWDHDDDVRVTAVRILGEYLSENGTDSVTERSESQRQVIGLLVGVFDDAEVQPWTRQQAYLSLCRGCGMNWEELPGDCVALNLSAGSPDIDWQLVDRCRELCSVTNQLHEPVAPNKQETELRKN